MAAIVSTIQALTNALCPARALTIVPATMTGFPGDGSSAYMLPLLQLHLAYMTQVTAPFSRDLPNAHIGHKGPIRTYLIFVIFFTQSKFLENKIYTKNANFSR